MLTEMKQITLYPSGATITKKVKKQCEKGKNELIVENLPVNLTLDHIQVYTLQEIRILSMNVSRDYLHQSAESKAVQQIKAQLEKINEEIVNTQVKLNLSYYEEKFLEKSGNENLKSLNDYENNIQLLAQMMGKIKYNQLEIENELNELNIRKSAFMMQLGDSANTVEASNKAVIEFEAFQSSEIEFEFSYFISDAGWTLTYDLRANDSSSTIQLITKAEIYQNTKEDWEEVPIILSTTNPNLGNYQPILYPNNLDFIQPQAPAMLRMHKEVLETSVMNDEQVHSYVRNEETNLEFTLPTPVTVKANGVALTIELNQFDLPAEYRYYSVRKIEKDVFLLAKITGWENLNLISGSVNLFVNQRYTGRTYLDMTQIKDELEIALNREPSILVNRIQKNDFKDKSFFGNSIKEKRGFDLVIKNLKTKSITVDVLDQIAISSNKDIVVDVIEISKATLDKETGQLKWVLSLDPGESVTLSVKYSVSYPSDKQISFH